MLFLSNLLTLPLAVQDMIMQMATTTATGYTILLHWQLYQIYPVLIAIPTLLIAAVLHFFVQSGKSQAKVEMAKMLKGSQEREKEENEKKRQRKEQKRNVRDRIGQVELGRKNAFSVNSGLVENQTNDWCSVELSSDSDAQGIEEIVDSLSKASSSISISSNSDFDLSSSNSEDRENVGALMASDYNVVAAPTMVAVDHFPASQSVSLASLQTKGRGVHVNRRQSLQQGIMALRLMEHTVQKKGEKREEEELFNLHQQRSLILPNVVDEFSDEEDVVVVEEGSDSSHDSDDSH
jgi:hypothetical protein